MLICYMRVSTGGDRQVLDVQRDALLATGVDERQLFEDRASGSRDDRTGLAKALAFLKPGDSSQASKPPTNPARFTRH
jgi:DNA invertase Pin-like site-specific DNA recombinase